ncbi:MAG TPA: NAD(P)-dependent oxidoreductase [Candidatus Acidoferrales bacterium]|jgi:3-hydroxyisobutyrate dehydrogenase-like beta-hydroxyacid dehydrogenase|nr:NAD(P)-dependent oxidoreductase [Candidatus Acidoferrales bacterium]
MKIGFLGLGKMGSGIAANLVRAGHEVTVWNRSAQKAEQLVAQGAALASTPKAAASGRELVMTMLGDDAALDQVLRDGLLEGLDRGALHVSLSTISVSTADRITALHADRGQRFLSAPVFGRPDAAAAAKLFIVAAGAEPDFKTASALFPSISQRVFYLGKTPSSANLVKLCGNFMILAAIECMAEAMTLAQKGGVPKKEFLEVMTGTMFDSPIYRNYGAVLVEERFKPAGFAAPLGLKDMRLVGQAGETLRVPMPVLNVLRDHLLQAIGTDGEDIDWSSIGRTVAKNGGL